MEDTTVNVCSADVYESSSEDTLADTLADTPPVSSGTPGELLVHDSLPTSAQLSWTPVPDDETITVQVEGPESTQEIQMDGNATSDSEKSSVSTMTEAGTESSISVSSTPPPNGECVIFTRTCM